MKRVVCLMVMASFFFASCEKDRKDSPFIDFDVAGLSDANEDGEIDNVLLGFKFRNTKEVSVVYERNDPIAWLIDQAEQNYIPKSETWYVLPASDGRITIRFNGNFTPLPGLIMKIRVKNEDGISEQNIVISEDEGGLNVTTPKVTDLDFIH